MKSKIKPKDGHYYKYDYLSFPEYKNYVAKYNATEHCFIGEPGQETRYGESYRWTIMVEVLPSCFTELTPEELLSWKLAGVLSD